MKSRGKEVLHPKIWSRPTRGAWIEISPLFLVGRRSCRRAPHGARGLKWEKEIALRTAATSRPTRGAWIEICRARYAAKIKSSRAPHGARGLKSHFQPNKFLHYTSRPTRGAWIEICNASRASSLDRSRPTRGAWIEILCTMGNSLSQSCRAPHGARGLKSPCTCGKLRIS